MHTKAFFEITNACNLSCDFCHKTKRKIKYISREEFCLGARRLRGFADYLYFHLMGEPLLHPDIGEFLSIAHTMGYRVILTTNGTLLDKRGDMLLNSRSLHKVSISLHCYEANSLGIDMEKYLESCFEFCARASEAGIISVMRLWNLGGMDTLNSEILDRMRRAFPMEWKEIYSGYKLKDKVFLEWGERFDWPDVEGEYRGQSHSCYGLRDQIGVLCDGSVVPCCLDAEGAITLGNIFESELEDILNCERACQLKSSFEKRCITEELCQRCGYASKRY